MNRAKAKLSYALLFVLPLSLGTILGGARVSDAQDLPAHPPAIFIATVQPEYFEKRPVYWYRNNWFYRDGQRWNYYRTEPSYLRDRRASWGGTRGRYRYHR